MTAHVRLPRVPVPDDPGRRAFLTDVIEGLSADPKRIPPKYFYDERGSQLFEAITRTAEYYPTRTETGILTERAGEIASFVPKDSALVEFGAGSLTKARILLAAAPIKTFVPVDISGTFLEGEATRLSRDVPGLRVLPVAADFTAPFALPAEIAGQPRVGFFPGSTLGNFEPHEATAFLRHAGELLGAKARMIIGVDLVKDPDVLTRAYNDAAGVTAEFNLNLLRRINRELGANFDLGAFWHRAVYNREQLRIEMHLGSKTRQRVRIDGRCFDFRRGETIHTESSYKYTPELFRTLANGAGWRVAESWTDRDKWFAVHALVWG
ncbi:L-histidine N(alpha)-methyltransferase [Rhodoplanes roseus]|uniref:L-histidine N(Alpha)-methyltransferase n=1 Tax=Rhodoplanes roseus TaxID=29409 RepID=A0A327L7W7_9BRAD|nr:L-histidine N(alpha)-methyltransferase [Rhodoplanes roseus]RAI43768.1 L-histidine N(alpha)-methyltransferase [Rhodoplanes roseus]